MLGRAYFEPAAGAPLPLLGSYAAVAVGVSVAALVLLGVWANGLLAAFGAARLLPG